MLFAITLAALVAIASVELVRQWRDDVFAAARDRRGVIRR